MQRELKYGLLIKEEANAKDWIYGGYTGIDSGILVEDGQWENYLPVYEAQSNKYFDTLSCVSYAALNCLETLHKRKYGQEVNWSDRFLAKASGTTMSGNYMATVAETIRVKGLVLEDVWPFKEFTSWNEYMADIPVEVYEYASESLEHYAVNWDWVLTRNTKDLMEVLKYAPLQVSVFAWGMQMNNLYQRTIITPNHLVELYGYKKGEYWLIYDHYQQERKQLAWDYNFGHIIRFNIEQKKPMLLEIENNVLCQLVEGKGAFGLMLDGKLIVDDLSKLLASFVVRNNGDIGNKTKALTQKQWDAFPKIDLKKRSI